MQDFIDRYNLEQVVNCHRLTELVLELTDRHGYAFGLQPGQDVWSNGKDLAQLFSDRMADRVEKEVRAEFEVKKETAKWKDELEKQTFLALAIDAAKKTAVTTMEITRVRQ